MLNAQKKGKRFERVIAKMVGGKRTPCSGALDFKGDIISIRGPFARFHFECKHQENLNIWKALEQAMMDAFCDKTPLVVFTRNHDDIYCAMKFTDLMNLVLEIEELKNETLEKE